MDLTPYTPITTGEFKGLYTRGLADECPPDHSPDCLNVNLSKKGEVASRFGTSRSCTVGHQITRMFAATPAALVGSALLCCDGNGHIYRWNGDGSVTALLTLANMTDFVAANMFGWTFIAPITSTNTASLYIWDGTNACRKAAGYGPTSSFSAANSGGGHVGPGVYKIACSFITNTGFTTPPGPVITGTFTPVTVTADGSHSISVTGIPVGGASVVARQLLITKGDLNVYYYIAAGFINDNSTTTATLNFYDTDLVISADDLFDLYSEVPCGFIYSGLQKYHGRLILWGNPANTSAALISNVNDAESFNTVTGILQLPDEHDGNTMAGCFPLQDILYATKSVGIFATQDNGLEPTNWVITQVDGVVGAGHYGIGTVTLTQLPLTTDNIALLVDYGGIHLFNGSVIEPPLTWKIQDIWNSIFYNTFLAVVQAQIAVDPFNQVIYVLIPVNSQSYPNVLLVGYYGEGLNAMAIKWTRWCLSSPVTTIGMLTMTDSDGGSGVAYLLRLGCIDGNVYKVNNAYLSDSGNAIDAHYKMAYSTYSVGGLNIFENIRIRANGSGTLNLIGYSEDDKETITPGAITLVPNIGQDYFRGINFMNEKMALRFGVNAVGDNFKVNRVDIFGKLMFAARPQQGAAGI